MSTNNLEELVTLVQAYGSIDAWETISLLAMFPTLGFLYELGMLECLAGPFVWVGCLFKRYFPESSTESGALPDDGAAMPSDDGTICQMARYYTGFLLVASVLIYWGVTDGGRILEKPSGDLSSYEKAYGIVASEVCFAAGLPGRVWDAFHNGDRGPDDRRTLERFRNAAVFWHAVRSLSCRDLCGIPLVVSWWWLRCALGGLLCRGGSRERG